MRLLIIEDDEFKREKLEKVLTSGNPAVVVKIAKSVNSGVAAIKSEAVIDIILLDMSLPTFDITIEEYGGQPRNFGGSIVLEQLLRNHLDIPCIIVSQYRKFYYGNRETNIDELSDVLRTDFPTLFRGMVKYDATGVEWEAELWSCLQKCGCARVLREA
jgi:CheY-like chemotaxis protein